MRAQRGDGAVQTWRDIHFSARDGLCLYARHYPAPGSAKRPLLCLAGLTRNGRDFHHLATALARADAGGRDVYTLDSRGRGRSEHDPDWNNYSLLVELNDALDFMTMKGLHGACLVGTSRGGLIAMLMAVLRPCALAAVVLNDIGPVIEREGLARIVAYAGRVPLPADWQQATELVREINKRHFPAVPVGDWEEQARAWFNEENGLPAPGYDPNIAKAFSVMDGPMPELWPQFGALAHVPVLAIRGQNSDILSAKTLEEMRTRHPRLEILTVPGQGHAPFLKDAPTIAAVTAFFDRTDDAARVTALPVPALA
jgi:pimeloyl-ACP methyl ester carboxylesterase